MVGSDWDGLDEKVRAAISDVRKLAHTLGNADAGGEPGAGPVPASALPPRVRGQPFSDDNSAAGSWLSRLASMDELVLRKNRICFRKLLKKMLKNSDHSRPLKN